MSKKRIPITEPAADAWSTPLDRFLALALASGLLSSGQLLAAVEAAGAKHGEPDGVERLGDYLVASGFLTRWQCDKLRSGQYKGFFLGQYKFVDVDPDLEAYHYLAEDLESHRRLKLLVKPNPAFPDGLEYREIE